MRVFTNSGSATFAAAGNLPVGRLAWGMAMADFDGVNGDDLVVTNKADGSTVRYRGKCDVIFRLEGNFWYIYEWRDLQGESDPDTGQLLNTMGVLRGTFGS